MKIINILFNYKKSSNDNKVLGVERCFVDYAKYLSLAGNQVVSVTKTNMVYCDEIRKTGSDLLELPAINRSDIFSILRLAFLFFRFKPDVVICHSGRAMSFARAARFFVGKKIPVVVIDHGINPLKFLKADYVLTVNSYFSKELVKAGKSQDRALVIPNMMEVPNNFVTPVKKPFQSPIRIGALGRLYGEKNFDKTLKAMAILRDRGIKANYVIGGVGPMKGALEQLAKELNLENEFKILGWVSDKKSFFDEVDIFILPSLGETFGIVLLEAMMYNTPIITSDSWGPDEIIVDGVDGLKVSKNDSEVMPKLLADAIERLVKDENFARNLAKKAEEKFYANYTANKVTQKLVSILEEIVRKGI